MLKNIVLLLRPKQWSKNVLVAAAWLFSGRLTDPEAAVKVLMAFVAMTAASSTIYVINDVLDVRRDRNHPTKRNRPIASGAVPVPAAIAMAGVLCAAALAVSWSLNRSSFALIVFYLLLQTAYNLRLKAVPILDVYVIATGFVLRAVLGATALSVAISGWFLFCTGALALMLGFAKRRHEFLLQGEAVSQSRESLAHYTKPALDALVTVFACGAAL